MTTFNLHAHVKRSTVNLCAQINIHLLAILTYKFANIVTTQVSTAVESPSLAKVVNYLSLRQLLHQPILYYLH